MKNVVIKITKMKKREFTEIKKKILQNSKKLKSWTSSGGNNMGAADKVGTENKWKHSL